MLNESFDKLIVTNGNIMFKKDNYIENMVLTDDGNINVYKNNKLIESKPFSKSTILNKCKSLLDEGYTVYVTSGEDGVYSTSKYDTVDSKEQAEDIVNELRSQGLGASYEEDTSNIKTEQTDLSINEPSAEDINTQIDNTKQAIDKIDELTDLKNELVSKVDNLVNESVSNKSESVWNKPLSYNELVSMNLEDHLTNKEIEYVKNIFGDVDTLKEDMLDILKLFKFKNEELLSIDEYIQELKSQGGII